MNEEFKKELERIKESVAQLENNLNKPQHEVGKVYKDTVGNRMFMITKLNTQRYAEAFGFGAYGNWFGFGIQWGLEDTIEATDQEWISALEKEAGRRYEGVYKVDRSSLDLGFDKRFCPDIEKFGATDSSVFNYKGFGYKFIYVMDKHGKWATPVVEEKDYDLEIKDVGCYVFKLESKEFEVGKYKLTKI